MKFCLWENKVGKVSAEGQGCSKASPQSVLSLFLGRGSTLAVSEQCKTPELCGGQFWGDCLVGYKWCWSGQGVGAVPAAFGAGGSQVCQHWALPGRSQCSWVLSPQLWFSLHGSRAGRVLFAVWGLGGAQSPDQAFKGRLGGVCPLSWAVGGKRHLGWSLGLGVCRGSFWSPCPARSAWGMWGAELQLKNPYFTTGWFLYLLNNCCSWLKLSHSPSL